MSSKSMVEENSKESWVDAGQKGNIWLRFNEEDKVYWLQWKHDGGTDNLFMKAQDVLDLFDVLLIETR